METSEKLCRTLPVNFPGSWESSDTRQHRQLQSIVERLRTVVKSREKPVLIDTSLQNFIHIEQRDLGYPLIL